MVTLGFGFKSYVSYKMRLRKQKEVQKENEFYMQLLQQALPIEQQMPQRQEREAEEGETHTHTHCIVRRLTVKNEGRVSTVTTTEVYNLMHMNLLCYIFK